MADKERAMPRLISFYYRSWWQSQQPPSPWGRQNAVEASAAPRSHPRFQCVPRWVQAMSRPRLAVFSRASGTLIHLSNPAVHTTPTMPPLGVCSRTFRPCLTVDCASRLAERPQNFRYTFVEWIDGAGAVHVNNTLWLVPPENTFSFFGLYNNYAPGWLTAN